MYWSVEAEVECPECGDVRLGEWQTHFMGDFGSCSNVYSLGEPVEELRGLLSAVISPRNGFIGSCQGCKAWLDVGFVVKDTAVVSLGPVVVRE